MKLPSDLLDELIRKLSELEDDDPGKFVAFDEFSPIFRDLEHPLPDDFAVPDVLSELVSRDWVESNNRGFDIREQGFRITAKGQNRASASVDYADQFSRAFSAIPSIDLNDAGQADEEPALAVASKVSSHDSESWTGSKYVLTDAKVIGRIRKEAAQIRDHIYDLKFKSNSDSQDLKSLADSLVAICEMAEPDLGIIERILAHPKFRYTAALTAAVATLRGALGV